MVDVDFKIVITGIISLSAIYMTMIICNHDTEIIGSMIVGAIALAIGVIIPSPKVDNKTGVLRW